MHFGRQKSSLAKSAKHAKEFSNSSFAIFACFARVSLSNSSQVTCLLYEERAGRAPVNAYEFTTGRLGAATNNRMGVGVSVCNRSPGLLP